MLASSTVGAGIFELHAVSFTGRYGVPRTEYIVMSKLCGNVP